MFITFDHYFQAQISSLSSPLNTQPKTFTLALEEGQRWKVRSQNSVLNQDPSLEEGGMGVHTTNMQFFLALFTCCLLLLLMNVEEVVSRKSPVASITKDDLMRSSTTPNLSFKAKRSDGSALRSDSDTNEILEKAQLHHDHQHLENVDAAIASLEESISSNSTNSSSSEDSSLPESDEDLSNTTATAKAMGNNSDKTGAGGAVDSDVIIGCVIMVVIIVLGLGIGLGLNIYGKRQDVSRDAAEFGIMDDLVEIHSNPDAH